ncbi:23030_t:CDS:2 [Cetraspora pellucida]|uniref:23030_t:CDS:1 n=1 Tax=Cetraspora pellucida TaxID=1433469 RepID=A0A9N9EI66_9GLOM|nr:23030_t:CDS:2 [Cetraspora pellucida]
MEHKFKELSEKYQCFHNNALNGINSNGVNSLNINPNLDQDACYEFFLNLVETKDEINNLLRFAALNIKAVNKTLKKFDKKLKKEEKNHYLEKINDLPLVSCSALIKLLESIEQWIREVHHKIADNNNHLSSPNHSLDNTALLNAIRNDDDSTLRNLIDEMVSDIRTENMDENFDNRMINQANPVVQKVLISILYKACYYQAFNCIKQLILSGVNILEEKDINKRSLIHKLVINGGILPRGNVTTSPATSPTLNNSSSSDYPRIISCILEHLPEHTHVFSLDIYGKNPLHYAASKGFVQITKTLLEYLMRVEQFSLEMAFNDNVWFDDNGYTPLFYATLNNKVEIIDCIMETGQIRDVDSPSNVRDTTLVPKLMNSSNTTQTLLAVSCKFGHCSVARSLLNHHANPNIQDEDGETPLHLASRGGFTECCKILISEYNANMEIRERYSGWTPLFLAAIEGHKETVEALIQSGAIHNIVDYSGWTPHMHAVFRGHLTMKNILRPSNQTILSSISTNHEIMVSPQDNISRQETSAEVINQNRYLKDQSLIIVTLGTTDIRKDDIVPIKFNNKLSYSSPVSLVIWAINATGEKVTIDLPIKDKNDNTEIDPPIKDNTTIDPIMFYAREQDLNDVTLIFDIMPIYGSIRQLIGRGTAALSSVKTYPGPNYTSLIGSVTVPIIGSLGVDVIGKIQFEYLVVKPFKFNNLENRKKCTWESLGTKVIGHRGMGENFNFKERSKLQMGENTVQNCQVTKDLIPVIYHDWYITETGFDIPIHSVTLNQFLKIKARENERNLDNDSNETYLNNVTNEIDLNNVTNEVDLNTFTDNIPNSNSSGRLKRSNSMSSLNKAKYRKIDENNVGKLKGNGAGTIQAPFATLEETIKKVPVNIGFNIEVKYPMIVEAEEFKLQPFYTELNDFCDAILKCVYEHAQPGRKIIFSTFHPEICSILAWKQPVYSVFFLTECGAYNMGDVRCNSLQAAIRFAKFAGLSGIVANCNTIIEAPGLTKIVKAAGLLLFTYGGSNNEVANAQLQKRAGVDAVIVDFVKAVKIGLEQIDNENQIENIVN